MPASTNTSYARYKELLAEMNDERLMEEIKKLRRNRDGSEHASPGWDAWNYMLECANEQVRSRADAQRDTLQGT
jgi:hypothetical protein